MSIVPTIIPVQNAPTLINWGLPVSWSDIDERFWWLAHRATGWQFGDGGMIQAIVNALGIKAGTVIECGAGDNCALPLTCRQLLLEGWRGILIEGDKASAERLARSCAHYSITNVNIANNLVDPGNFDDLVVATGGEKADLLILDTNSFEYWIAKAMKIRPTVVCIEHHDLADKSPPYDIPPIEECGKTPTCFCNQASYTATRELMEELGYVCVGKTRINGLFVLADRADEVVDSLNEPGGWPCPEKPTATIVLSMPRVGFVNHTLKIAKTCQELGYNVAHRHGAFWDRDMSVCTSHAIKEYGADYLVFSDYDSVFEASDVKTLIDAINADPNMGAIGSIQMSRHDDKPLVFDKDAEYFDADGKLKDVTRVQFQHFGLTVIRRQVFEMLPQPWFWSVPNMDGSWEANDRSDADITFWRVCTEHGIKVCQHNKVVIGHILLGIKYPGPKGTRLIPIENYERRGKPKDCVFNPRLYMPLPPEAQPKTE